MWHLCEFIVDTVKSISEALGVSYIKKLFKIGMYFQYIYIKDILIYDYASSACEWYTNFLFYSKNTFPILSAYVLCI